LLQEKKSHVSKGWVSLPQKLGVHHPNLLEEKKTTGLGFLLIVKKIR
jgi:hypothetical protein